MLKLLLLTLIISAAMPACTGNGRNETNAQEATQKETVTFNADTAYNYVRQQVMFGPRVPGTDAHRRCAEWIASTLAASGADTIIVQNAQLSAFNGDELPITNIMAMYNPEANDRVLLAAHYDTRPWADNADNEADRARPIPGANDGGSGVAVLLEIARQLGQNNPQIGVDLLFVDAEDYGNSEGFGMNEETWCLGTQYWASHMPYTQSNRPRFGIVLDMVGGTNARFHREYYSDRAAKAIVDKVWGEAARSGLSSVFVNELGGSLIDDHIFINRAGIPCIDIVECNNALTRTFPATWHTHHDDIAAIDINSLRAAGQTVVNVIFAEKPTR